MFFDTLFQVLKFLIPLYVMMIFLASCRRLSYVLSILFSIGTIVAITFVRTQPNGAELVWIPIVTSLASTMLRGGESYMNPSIVENLFQVISVERKWNSIFADDDEYIVHLSPVEAGGFIENTIFALIFFFLCYSDYIIFGESWIVYVPAMYALGQSIFYLALFIAYTAGIFDDFPTFIHGLGMFLIILVVLAIGITGHSEVHAGSMKKQKFSEETERLYAKYSSCAQLDYTRSYLASYDYYIPENIPFPTYFIFDSEKNIAAEYTLSLGEKKYDMFYAYDPCLEGMASFINTSPRYLYLVFNEYISENKHPFKYGSTIEYIDFMNVNLNCEFTKEKIEYSTKETNEYDNTFTIRYNTENDPTRPSSKSFQVTYCFGADDNGNPLLLYMEYSYYAFAADDYVHQLRYEPIYGETGLESFLDLDGCLNGYDHTKKVDPLYDKLAIITDRAFFDVKGAVYRYDFQLKETSAGSSRMYIHDAETNTVAMYSDHFANGSKAAENNDFITYRPDLWISNPDRTIYNSRGELLEICDVLTFVNYTYDNSSANGAIDKCLGFDFGLYNSDITFLPNGDISTSSEFSNYGLYGIYHQVDIRCDFYLKKVDENNYTVESLKVTFVYDERTYEIVFFFEDCFDIAVHRS